MTHEMNIMTLHVLEKFTFIQNILTNKNISLRFVMDGYYK